MAKEDYFYCRAAHHKASEKMVLERDMLHAFEKEQFHLVYQPIVDAGGRVSATRFGQANLSP